jgi:hypothetical protein
MMKHIRIIGLALVAVFAFSAIAAVSASAAKPEFKPFQTGKPKKHITFTWTSGKPLLETVGGSKRECQKGTGTGELTGPKTDTTTVTFKECTAFGFPCTTPGAGAGEIKTVLLESTLGYITRKPKVVGDSLSPKGGGDFTTFVCAGVTIVEKGSVIGALTPTNALGVTYTLTFTQLKGVQKPIKLEGGAKDVLETSIGGGAFEESAEQTTATLTMSSATTLKA